MEGGGWGGEHPKCPQPTGMWGGRWHSVVAVWGDGGTVGGGRSSVGSSRHPQHVAMGTAVARMVAGVGTGTAAPPGLGTAMRPPTAVPLLPPRHCSSSVPPHPSSPPPQDKCPHLVAPCSRWGPQPPGGGGGCSKGSQSPLLCPHCAPPAHGGVPKGLPPLGAPQGLNPPHTHEEHRR